MSKGYIKDDLFDRKDKEKEKDLDFEIKNHSTILEFISDFADKLAEFTLNDSDFGTLVKFISSKRVLENKLSEITEILNKKIDDKSIDNIDEDDLLLPITNDLIKCIEQSEKILEQLKDKD